jgi:hypothetical protein
LIGDLMLCNTNQSQNEGELVAQLSRSQNIQSSVQLYVIFIVDFARTRIFLFFTVHSSITFPSVRLSRYLCTTPVVLGAKLQSRAAA